MAFEGVYVGLLGKVTKWIEKYGIFRVLEGALVCFVFVYVLYNIANLDNVVREVFISQTELHDESQIDKHDKALEVRKTIKPDVDLILKENMAKLDADRVFIMEMHNGTNNTSGLPFIYGEMTYEIVRNGINHIDEDYINMNLSRFNFPLYLEENHIWIGSVKDLAKVDDKLAARIGSNGATYLAITTIQGVSNELGYFGLTYCNGKTPASEKEIRVQLFQTVQKLSILLDSKNIK